MIPNVIRDRTMHPQGDLSGKGARLRGRPNMNQRNALPAMGLALALVASGCAPVGTLTPTNADSRARIANPASVFCEANGGTLELRTASDGSVSGVCLFPDGTECEEWAFFRGECRPASTAAATDSLTVPPAEPLALQVLVPQDGSLVTSAQNQLAGTTAPNAVVTVNDEILIAGPDGAFQTTVVLEEGVNLIEVVASDAHGREAFINLAVTYQP
jgi:putative hemolysin